MTPFSALAALHAVVLTAMAVGAFLAYHAGYFTVYGLFAWASGAAFVIFVQQIVLVYCDRRVAKQHAAQCAALSALKRDVI